MKKVSSIIYKSWDQERGIHIQILTVKRIEMHIPLHITDVIPGKTSITLSSSTNDANYMGRKKKGLSP